MDIRYVENQNVDVQQIVFRHGSQRIVLRQNAAQKLYAAVVVQKGVDVAVCKCANRTAQKRRDRTGKILRVRQRLKPLRRFADFAAVIKQLRFADPAADLIGLAGAKRCGLAGQKVPGGQHERIQLCRCIQPDHGSRFHRAASSLLKNSFFEYIRYNSTVFTVLQSSLKRILWTSAQSSIKAEFGTMKNERWADKINLIVFNWERSITKKKQQMRCLHG